MLCPGETFEGYVVEDVLGHGGSATVFRAHTCDDPHQAVALKVLADDHRGAADTTRLQREFDFADQLRHPHVVSVYRRGDHWLAMQLVNGATATALERLDDRLTAMEQIADALDYVHRCGIVHCDVKPANVLVYQDFSRGGAVLIDFGVAYAVVEERTKRPQPLVASLPYLAPEMLRGRAPAAASDEYALACTTVELVTGSTPFTAATPAAMAAAQLDEPPPYPSRTFGWLPRGFDGVIGKALAKDPELRYPTCTEFVAAVVKVFRR
ncbi:MAG: serine/threonine protein kinase [Mycobacteriaceae bacterium]|nr:serine/threonine protein kinase [Mycobacteriaceae bacterium]